MTASSTDASKDPKPRRVNVRIPEVMQRVQARVESHYQSGIVEKVRSGGGSLTIGNTTVRLAKEFGFCYGVERAIDLAYAARDVFPKENIYLIGEIIHNPEVNHQLAQMGILSLVSSEAAIDEAGVNENDVVIVPAFGTTTGIMDLLRRRQCVIVDTTCGDVMSVWRRVRAYSKAGATAIIHGKAHHEETLATASRACEGEGHYLVLLGLEDVDYVCDYIVNGGDRGEFLRRFEGSFCEGFDPELHLKRVGVANQTTMLKSETLEVQRRIAEAIKTRDGEQAWRENFQFFDTICGATQERQDALYEMLKKPPDMMLVVGGYNSSNTTHLVEISEKKLPTFFIANAERLKSLEQILHFDIHERRETTSYTDKLVGDEPFTAGITAGASCPYNLIAETIYRVFELRGIPRDQVK